MFEKLAVKLGASPIHYKLLLKNEKTIEKHALKGKQGITKWSLALYCAFTFLLSIFSALLAFIGIDVYIYALIGITMSMSIVAMWTLPYFDNLLSPIHYPVIAHTPVSSRTYFMVKLTQIFKSSILLLLCLNILPSISGIFLSRENLSGLRYLFPLVYLPIAFLSGFFTIGVMASVAGYLTKLYSIKRLQKIAKSAQFILPFLFPFSFYLIPTKFLMDKYDEIVKWFYYLPNGWFAGIVSLAVSITERTGFQRDLILSVAAIGSTLLLITIPLRSIAKTYSSYLSFLLESEIRRNDKLRIRKPILSRYFKSREVYASFCLCAIYIRRDRKILYQLASGPIFCVILMPIFFVKDIYQIEWLKYSVTIGLSPFFTYLYVCIAVSIAIGFLNSVRYSQHWKASWVLSLTPFGMKSAMWRGVELVTLICINLPFTLFALGGSIVLWGVLGVINVLPGLLLQLYVIVTYPLPKSKLPLSEELVEREFGVGCIATILYMIATTGLLGILYLAWWIHIWVYVGVYSIIVVGGFIGLIKLKKEK